MANSIQSEIIGALKQSDYCFEGAATHKSSRISISLVCEKADSVTGLLRFAEKIWKGRVRHFKSFRVHAVTCLLDQLNEFLDCGEDIPKQLSAGQLRKILTLPYAMSFYMNNDNPAFEIRGGDDPLLDDHGFVVYFDANGNVTDGEVYSID